jgi:hypothetical protein
MHDAAVFLFGKAEEILYFDLNHKAAYYQKQEHNSMGKTFPLQFYTTMRQHHF